ncbi:MAG: hypothetical protein ACRD5K_05320 [Candidatus Acidiferrales bacterium]
MRRMEISELHEMPWFPQYLRDLVTDALQSVLSASRLYHPISDRLSRAVGAAGASRVIDLCSGGGGPWLWLHSALRTRESISPEIVLTDKYPNLRAFEHARCASHGAISYSAEPVEAAQIPAQLSGFRTIFSSFHHFSPREVIAMLQDAADHRQGFGAFEGARRRVSTMLAVVFVPAAALITAPFIRPFRVSRLFWTYLLPVIPLILFVDGVLSCMRAYSPAEMIELCGRIVAPGYVWDAGEAPGRFGRVTFLLGYLPQSLQPSDRTEATSSSLR